MALTVEEERSIPNPLGGRVALVKITDDAGVIPDDGRRNNVICIRDEREVWRIKRAHELHGGNVIASIYSSDKDHFTAESYDGVVYEVSYADGTAVHVRWEKT
ncbi:MAG: hypothetical protein H0W86_14240 [Armatimonadetes bacterium]|nr:hypothetical protein [Armatimonadota bacterium]